MARRKIVCGDSRFSHHISIGHCPAVDIIHHIHEQFGGHRYSFTNRDQHESCLWHPPGYGNHDGDSAEQLCFHIAHCNTRIGIGLFFKVPDVERDGLVGFASQPFWVGLFFNHVVILLADDRLPIADDRLPIAHYEFRKTTPSH